MPYDFSNPDVGDLARGGYYILSRKQAEALYADLTEALGMDIVRPPRVFGGAEAGDGPAETGNSVSPAEALERMQAAAQTMESQQSQPQPGRRPGTGIGGSRNP